MSKMKLVFQKSKSGNWYARHEDKLFMSIEDAPKGSKFAFTGNAKDGTPVHWNVKDVLICEDAEIITL